MSEFTLVRHRDPSGVSGTGNVADGYEAPDGAVVVRWRGDRPSWGVWNDMRDMEATHGHQGATVVEYLDPYRLLAGYKQIVFWLLTATEDSRPMSVVPHPDWPDRLLCRFRDAASWRFWIGLMDGSSYAATHMADGSEIRHTWVTPEGNVWLEYRSPTYEDPYDEPEAPVEPQPSNEDPLETYDREDRG